MYQPQKELNKNGHPYKNLFISQPIITGSGVTKKTKKNEKKQDGKDENYKKRKKERKIQYIEKKKKETSTNVFHPHTTLISPRFFLFCRPDFSASCLLPSPV